MADYKKLCEELREISTKNSVSLYKRGVCEQATDAIEELQIAIEELQADNKQLHYTLWGVMHSVDKWLDGDELKQSEVNRAADMREKTLRMVEALQAERDKWLDQHNIAALNWQESARWVGKLETENERLKKQLEAAVEDLKYYLETNEESGVVYIPKFVVEIIVKQWRGEQEAT